MCDKKQIIYSCHVDLRTHKKNISLSSVTFAFFYISECEIFLFVKGIIDTVKLKFICIIFLFNNTQFDVLFLDSSVVLVIVLLDGVAGLVLPVVRVVSYGLRQSSLLTLSAMGGFWTHISTCSERGLN